MGYALNKSVQLTETIIKGLELKIKSILIKKKLVYTLFIYLV